MKKKVKDINAQVTIFIILVVIIISIIIFYVYLLGKKEERVFDFEKINPEIQPIYDYINICIKEIGEDAIEYVSLRGGYYTIPELSLDLEVPYYLYLGNDYSPTTEEIEEQISLYVENNLNFCSENSENFADYKISFDNPNVKTIIEDNEVNFKVKYSVKLSKNNKNYVIEDFESNIDVRLGVILNTINKINEYKNEICINCIYNLTIKNDLYIDMIEYDDSLIYVVRDENSKINDKYFIFVFANKYREF